MPYRKNLLALLVLAMTALSAVAADAPPTTAPCCAISIKSVKVDVVKLRAHDAPPAPTEDSTLFQGLKEEQAGTNQMETNEKLLIVRIEVKNQSAQKCVYHSLNGTDEKCPTFASVHDDARKVYALAKFGDFDVIGAVKGARELPPGKTLNDILVFEIPPASVKSLDLHIPHENVGAKEAVQPLSLSLENLKLAGT